MKNHEFSNYTLALTVVACSAILFIALAFALKGKTFSRVSRDAKANFADITGIKVGSQVKYAGALAGTVSNIRFLTSEERKNSANPQNTIQLTLGLYKEVPPIPNDTIVTIDADTLLADKFVGLSGGTLTAPAITQNDVLQGLTPITIDSIARNSGTLMHSMDGRGNALSNSVDGILPNIRNLITQAQGMATDAQGLVKEISQLVRDTKTPARDTLAKVQDAATRLQSLSQSAESILRNNEKDIKSTIVNLNISSQNLKVTSTYAKSLTQTLAERPSILIWGNRNLPIPSQQEILRSNQPIPTR